MEFLRALATVGIGVEQKRNVQLGVTVGLLYLGKQLIDIEVAWIEDRTKRAYKMNNNHSDHV